MQLLTRFILAKEAHMKQLAEEQNTGEEDMNEYYLDMTRDSIVRLSLNLLTYYHLMARSVL